MPAVLAKTYAQIASLLHDGEPEALEAIGTSVVVFDTHGGRYPFLLLMAVAWHIRRLAELANDHGVQTHATVLVLSPSRQCIWTERALSRHFLHRGSLDPSFLHCSILKAKFQIRIGPVHDDQPVELGTILESVIRALDHNTGAPELGPSDVVFGSCMLPLEDTRLGQAVKLPERAPAAEFRRLGALNLDKDPAHNELVWAGPATSSLKPIDHFPWSGDIFELLVCCISGLQHGMPGALDSMWWCLEDFPIFPFDMETFRKTRRWFLESIRQLCRWGLVNLSAAEPGDKITDAMKQPGLFVSQDWGSPVQKLLVTGRAVSVYEAMLVVALGREEHALVRHTLAAIAAVSRLGIRTIIRRSISDTEPTYELCQAACSGTGAALAARGRIWLALGLLHRAKTAKDDDQLRLGAANLVVGYPRLALVEQHMRSMLNSDSDGMMDGFSGRRGQTGALGWADDHVPPPPDSYGVHFGLQRQDREGSTGYTTTMMAAVSDKAVFQVMDNLFPPKGNKGRDFHALLESHY
ncbi:hypothetical protein B0T21DRAFT_451955 [Apiosordaria backusii]|uniref:Uncharacterized protein n=1 Tax=Apiosordaria backusii TaxID=314023 RepID=A0AA40E8M5_9PEZI|nr:hypothetical protein B0T21DRAFT_451955 [Apiosordaria backusii]